MGSKPEKELRCETELTCEDYGGYECMKRGQRGNRSGEQGHFRKKRRGGEGGGGTCWGRRGGMEALPGWWGCTRPLLESTPSCLLPGLPRRRFAVGVGWIWQFWGEGRGELRRRVFCGKGLCGGEAPSWLGDDGGSVVLFDPSNSGFVSSLSLLLCEARAWKAWKWQKRRQIWRGFGKAHLASG